jgi:hypothetical protein
VGVGLLFVDFFVGGSLINSEGEIRTLDIPGMNRTV